MSFCTNCGQPVTETSEVCTHCGARPAAPPHVGTPSSAPPATASPSFQEVLQPPQTLSPAKPTGALPFVLLVVGALALIAVVSISSIIYVGYRVKQKVSSVAKVVGERAPALEKAISPGVSPASESPSADNPDVAAVLGSLLGGGEDGGDQVPSISADDPVVPCSPARYPSQSRARIPLQPGTTITTAWGIARGDVETRTTIASLDPASLTLTAAASEYDDESGHQTPEPSTHTVCYEDLQTADDYGTVTGPMPQIIHGLSRLRISDKAFQEIKSTGKLTSFIYWQVTPAGLGELKPNREGGILTRVEPGDIAYPMLVNDQRVTLPVIHLAGITESMGKDPRPPNKRPLHTETDLYVMDDPVNPLVLLLKMKELHDPKFRIEVTKLDFTVEHPVNTVEKQLAETKKAVTWGIYFDFNQDTIKPESTPVLKEIAEAMQNNPKWKLTVAGNTDNIGGDTYNLDLSKRRAAQVKEALVTQYSIDPDRLSTDGYGAACPIETNDTLEGRARNRRVELTRD